MFTKLALLLAAQIVLSQGGNAKNAEELLTEAKLSEKVYNKYLPPSRKLTDVVNVSFDMLISQLIDVNEREEFMITKVWLRQRWVDYRLSWDPAEFGNITRLQVSSSKIWLPDIVLYNNADGEYEVSLKLNTIVLYNGTVSWTPPAIYRSVCNIKVSDFPFDEQECPMTFRSWTYGRNDIELHLTNNVAKQDDFTPSGEWDIIDTPGIKRDHEDGEPYQDITYTLIIKRKPRFYTVNLIIPCILITFLAILVFYTPSDSGEKMTLCISVLLALTFFLLLLSKMVPSTSLDVPLIGKYLMFTMVLVTLSVISSVIVLNLHHRKESTHTMPEWVRVCFLNVLPPLLLLNRPSRPDDPPQKKRGRWECLTAFICFCTGKFEEERPKRYFVNADEGDEDSRRKFGERGGDYGIRLSDVSGSRYLRNQQNHEPAEIAPKMLRAMQSVESITNHLKARDFAQRISEDWKYVAVVVDRLFLFIFVIAFFAGTLGIFIQPFI